MHDALFIALRESLQSSLLLFLVIVFPAVASQRTFVRSLLIGAVTALFIGMLVGYFPAISRNALTNEDWFFWRLCAESVTFYLSVLLVLYKPRLNELATSASLFLLGFSLYFFEARGLWFLIRDLGAMQGNATSAAVGAAIGFLLGAVPFLVFRRWLSRIPINQAFVLPSLLMTIGALQFWFGGVAELEHENIMVPLQRGLMLFLGSGMASFQSALQLSPHPFIEVPFAGLARYLSGDRMALGITVLFIMTPPVLLFIHLFAQPDPLVHDLANAAKRRQKVAFFRDTLLMRTIPVMIVFIVLVVLLHAVNVSMNPLYEPPPVPIREEAQSVSLRVPLSDRTGDFADKKLRKYVYYFGNKQIILIAIMKADGTIGLALDECEICRPAEWNTDAKGYAQKGEHLICKYCMSPVATAAVNNPGGCNPIPIPFKTDAGSIVINLNDLVTLYQKVQALEKQGTHL